MREEQKYKFPEKKILNFWIKKKRKVTTERGRKKVV